ncbi:hypothetical protein [Streptomyces sp. NPDC006446]|uniref:hypothetical protein n=1 Tax=Streptomyces sp. NPDC006446 TaxID=3154301 RepID=UPI0033B42683
MTMPGERHGHRCEGLRLGLPGSGDSARPVRGPGRAGLTLLWNSGVVEGHVNRIKMLKRKMFGRAGFDLLRQRVLLA